MALLDQVIEMQRGGMTSAQIFANLNEQKISPKEIQDALNQAQIKNALNENTMIPQTGEQQSIMSSAAAPAPPEQIAAAPQMQAPQAVPQDAPQDYYTQTPDAYNQGYDNGGYGAASFDSDSISEISQQVVDEGFKQYKKKTGDIISFKNSTEEKLSDLSSRLERLEKTIDKLQSSIIQKVGEFGENTAYIRKDLESLHETTSSLMNPLIDNLNATKKKTNKKK
ncbi:hypothetical protein HN747_00040 [archaeon]|jgi:chaperonin cofactor prefoldin|nr:hypothetical protein [archaeon]